MKLSGNSFRVSLDDSNEKKQKPTNKQTNEHFYIDNISAKSSLIFTKLSGNLFGGILRLLKTNK